jgi:PAS domain S-box-containing protein
LRPMQENINKKQFKSYFESLLKASKAKTIDKKLKYLSEGLQKIGWQKIGIFTYSDDMSLSASFVTGIDSALLEEINDFRTVPLERQDLIKKAEKQKSFYISWDDALRIRGGDIKTLYKKLGYSETDKPIGLLIFLKTNSRVVGSMHLLKDYKEGWEKNLDIIELYANYAAHIIEEYQLKREVDLSNRRYRAAFENNLAATAIVDKEKQLILYNTKFSKLIAQKNQKMTRINIHNIIAGDSRMFDKVFDNALKGMREEISLKIKNSKDEEIPVRIFLRPQKFEDSVSQVELIIEDMRSGLDLLKRAKISESSYKLIYENAAEGIGLFTLNGDFVSCNPGGLQQTGYTEKELIGMNFDILVEEKIKPVAKRIFSKAASGVALRGRYFNIIRKDGGRVALAISSAPIRSFENEIIGVMLISRDISAEIEAFRAKEKSEKEYRRVLEHLQDIYYRCDEKGHIEYINPAVEKILGYKDRKALIGKSLLDTLCYDKQAASETYAKLLNERFIYNSPFMSLKENGEPLYCEENAHLVFDENGGIAGWEGTIRDESRRIAAEKALANSVEQLETITKNLPLGVYRTTTDLEGKIIYLNPAFPKLFGYKNIEEMEKVKPLVYYYEPELRSDFLKILSKEGSLKNVEYRMFKKNGDIIWVSDSCFAVKDESGKIQYIDGILEDITSRKELEEELRDSEKRYRLIAENVSDVIWILDMELRYTYISPSVKELRGYTSEELIGESIKESLTESSLEIVNKIFNEQIASFSKNPDEIQSGPITLEVEMNHKDGSNIWAEVKAVVIKDKKNKPIGLQGVTRDITARKRAEEALADQLKFLDEKVKERTRELAKTNEELIRSNRIKSEFLANISHELRSPLTSILGYAEMLQGIDEFNEESSNYLGIIGAQGNQLLRLVDSLLDIAKYESGTLKLSLSLLNVNDIIKQVEEHMLLKLKKANLAIETKLDSSIFDVNLDSQKVYQIIRNLIDNAIKFSPEHRSIIIESRLLESEIQVKVKDQGIGISDKHLSSIFDPFYQIDSSSTRLYEGAGLGLHLVKNFVNMHHGRVWVESEQNKGTTFTVCFPTNLQRPFDSITPKEGFAALRFPPSEEKHKILMVDDDNEISRLVQIMLRHQYFVVTAKNGKEAVEMALDIKPDMVLMDLSMPVLDGYEATKILKSRIETSNIPIIALSARAMKGEIEKALQVGCDAHLAKPFKLNELIEIIKKFLK